MSNLPPGWAESPIGSLCTLNNGRAFKPTDWKTEGIPIVRIQNLNNPNAPYNYFSGEFQDRYHLRGGELLFAWSGTPGTSFGAHVWHGSEAVLNQHIFRIDFDKDFLDKRFFRYAINQKLEELISIAHGGVGLRHVTKGTFERTLIAVPPRNEQQRIADKLDAVLERVDACRERLDRVPAILKHFRQAVLAAATSGKLTEDWRSPGTDVDVNAWERATIGALLEGKPRNGYSPPRVEHQTPVKSLTLTATTTGRFLSHHFKYIDKEVPVGSHLWLQSGDILIQRANTMEYVGISAVYDGPPNGFIYPDLMMKCRANERVQTEFLHYLLLSDPVRRHFRENATGTAGNMPKINQQTVLTAPALLPPLEEQSEIVRRVESLFAYADRLEVRYAAARAQFKRLTPALLAKAFRGELVPQDPNDKPASVLLERIRAMRAAAPAKLKRGRAAASSAVGRQTANPSQVDQSQLTDIAKPGAGRTERGEDDEPDSTYSRSAIR